MAKNDSRSKCEKIIWDGSRCKRPAAWLTEENELLCSYHGGLCNADGSGWYGEEGESPPKAIQVVNTKSKPYIRG